MAMTTAQKGEAIELLKEKFSQYDNFYITNTEALSVEQSNNLRRICFEKNVEMKVAKNTLIRKALEQLDEERFKGTFDSLHGVTALMFSESAKEPAVIISTFRKDNKAEKPVLKAAFVDGDVFVGEGQMEMLKTLKSKTELLGEIITLLQSPAKNVISGLNAGSKLASLVQALEAKAAS